MGSGASALLAKVPNSTPEQVSDYKASYNDLLLLDYDEKVIVEKLILKYHVEVATVTSSSLALKNIIVHRINHGKNLVVAPKRPQSCYLHDRQKIGSETRVGAIHLKAPVPVIFDHQRKHKTSHEGVKLKAKHEVTQSTEPLNKNGSPTVLLKDQLGGQGNTPGVEPEWTGHEGTPFACAACKVNFKNSNLMERHFKYSHTHAQIIKDLDKELQIGQLSPKSRREREVIELVQRFLRNIRRKRHGLLTPPKGLSVAERSSSESAILISDLACRRWSWAFNTVLRRNQVRLMTMKWDKMDSKVLASEGYLQPVQYFSGSRLFLRGTARTFVDVTVYLHATVGEVEGPGSKEVKSILEVLSSTVNMGSQLNRIYIDYEALERYLVHDVDVAVSGAQSVIATDKCLRRYTDSQIEAGRKIEAPKIHGNYIIRKLEMEYGDELFGDSVGRLVYHNANKGDHAEGAEKFLSEKVLVSSFEINIKDIPHLRPVLLPRVSTVRRHSDSIYSSFLSLTSDSQVDSAEIDVRSAAAQRALKNAESAINLIAPRSKEEVKDENEDEDEDGGGAVEEIVPIGDDEDMAGEGSKGTGHSGGNSGDRDDGHEDGKNCYFDAPSSHGNNYKIMKEDNSYDENGTNDHCREIGDKKEIDFLAKEVVSEEAMCSRIVGV